MSRAARALPAGKLRTALASHSYRLERVPDVLKRWPAS